MPEVFNKTRHSLLDIKITWDEFEPVQHPEYFWEKWYIYLLFARVKMKALHHGWGLCQFFLSLE